MIGGLGAVVIGLLAYAFLFFPQLISQSVMDGLEICASAILSSLFPFFVLSELWIRLGYAKKCSQALQPIMVKLFHLPGSAASALILGIIGGYPVGARTAAQLYKDGQLTKLEAEQTLTFCNNAGPAFIFGVIGVGVFGSVSIGAVLYGIHLLAAILSGLLLRPCAIPQTKHESHSFSEESISQAIVSSIAQGGDTALRVCIFVVFFSVLTGCLKPLLPENIWSALLLGTFELANGANGLSALSLSNSMKFIVAAFLLGWGGFCVLLQSASILQAAGLKIGVLIKGKLVHAILSTAIAMLLVSILPLSAPCFTYPSASLWLFNLQNWSMLLMLFCFTGVFVKKTSGKLPQYPV